MTASRIVIGSVVIAALLAGCGGTDNSADLAAQSKALERSQKAAAANYQTVVQELYVSYFGRPADPAGLANFEAALLAANAPHDIQGLTAAYSTNTAVHALIDSFGTSKESQNLYGGGTTSDFVTAVFQNVLGRAPLSAGLNYWTTAIDSGVLSHGDAALAIMAGGLANTTTQGLLDAQLINNRLAVSANFTAAVPASAYSGATAASSARSMLATVNSSTNVAAFQATVTATISTLSAINNQKVFEGFALNGGESSISAYFPYGGGNMVSGTNYIYATVFNGISQSPASAGAQFAISANVTLDSALPPQDASNTRILQGGQVLLLSSTAERKISYVGSQIQVQALAADGQTVLRTTQFYNYSVTPLSGMMSNSSEELFAAVPINQWIRYNNFLANAAWTAGSAYIKKQGSQVGDFIIVRDCTNTTTPVYTSGTAVTPCSSGATLDNLFPLTLVDSRNDHPTETDFASDGTISTVQGLRMWIANSPLPEADSATQTYRVFFEMNGNVYIGSLEKDGTPFHYAQPDGSVVDYSLTLNQSAQTSIRQGVITGAVIPGSELGTPGTVGQTVDLFGIGGSGINGALSPADLRKHYNIPATLTGAGQTIAIVDAPGTGDVSDDLDVYSQYYGLPLCNTANGCFQHIDLSNGAAITASADYGGEVELDTQMAHAIAPAAKIILVTSKSRSSTDLNAAINYAAALPGVTTVSMSFGGTGFSAAQEAQFASFQAKGGPLFFASSGDQGYTGSTIYPASSQYVTAVGGTAIHAVNWTSNASETAWQDSGGGTNTNLAMPSWQAAALSTAVVAANNSFRALPDVAAVADGKASAVSIYYKDAWGMYGGTSVAAPVWAGIGALLAQSLSNSNQTLLQLASATPGGFNGLLYHMATSATGSSAFYDVVAGSNNLTANPCTVCSALPGYDNVTGLGAPNVALIAANLTTQAATVVCGGHGGSGFQGLSFSYPPDVTFTIANLSAGQSATDTINYGLQYNNSSQGSTTYSGSLRLQFWAASANYEGSTLKGFLMATMKPNMTGQYAYSANQMYNDSLFPTLSSVATGQNPPAGTYCPVIVLEEYGLPGCTATDGYCTVDWRNGTNPWTFK